MHISLDEAQLEILKTTLNNIIQSIKELTKSVEKLAEEIKRHEKT